MEQVKQVTRGGEGRARGELVERIVAARPDTPEEAASALVDAIAELCEREGARAHSTVMGLVFDGDAQQAIATALGCRVEWVPCLIGAGAHVLSEDPACRDRRRQLAAIVAPWLRR